MAHPVDQTPDSSGIVTDVVVLSAATTVAEAGRETLRNGHPRQAYLVVRIANNTFVVMRWDELEALAPAFGRVVLDLPLGDLMAQQSKASTVSLEAYQAHEPAYYPKEGERLVVLDGEQVVGVVVGAISDAIAKSVAVDLLQLIAARDAASQASLEAATPEVLAPATRQLNAWIDGDKGSAQAPLVVNRRYTLRLDVGAPRQQGLAVSPLGDLRSFTTPGTETVQLAVVLDADPVALRILGLDTLPLEVPVSDGASVYEAIFQIMPLALGTITVRAHVFARDQRLQTLVIRLNVVEHEADTANQRSSADTIIPVTARGYTLDSLAALRVHPHPVSLILSPTANGYQLLLVGGVSARAQLRVSAEALTELLREARDALKAAVYGVVGSSYVYQDGLDVPETYHQVTLESLAKIGRRLFEALFFLNANQDAVQVGELLQQQSRGHSLHIQVIAERFVFPWALVYDRPRGEPITIEGFWGFKHIIEQLPEAGSALLQRFQPAIRPDPSLHLTYTYNADIDRQLGRPLVAEQAAFLAKLSGIALTEQQSEAQFLQSLDDPQNIAQVLYLFCHAESVVQGDRAEVFVPGARTVSGYSTVVAGEALNVTRSRLIISSKEGLTLRQLLEGTDPRLALPGAPLVYLNACQSAELSPLLYEGLVPFFISKGARGVLGTEVDTPAVFAAAFAQRFFAMLVQGEQTVGEILLTLRQGFVREHNNVMGLLYSLYASGDVRVERVPS